MLGYLRFPGSEGGCGTGPPVFLTKGLGLALSECLLLAANPAAARCPGVCALEGTCPSRTASGWDCHAWTRDFIPVTSPAPPTLTPLRGRLWNTCSSSRPCCSCCRRRFPAKPRTDGLRTVSTRSLRRGPLPAPMEQRALAAPLRPAALCPRGGEKTCLTLDSEDKHFKKKRLPWQDHAQL